MTDELNATPLKYVVTAPDFWLNTPDGKQVTRHEFRNKSALVVLFFEPTGAGWQYLQDLTLDMPTYRELNVQLVGIILGDSLSNQPAKALPVTLLLDPTDKAWQVFNGGQPIARYGVFVLDLYGGVEGQQIAQDVEGLPKPSKVKQWAEGAQYKCTI